MIKLPNALAASQPPDLYTFNWLAVVSNNKSPTSREELGSEDATLYQMLLTKSFMPDTLDATVFTLEISVATVDMFDITPDALSVAI